MPAINTAIVARDAVHQLARRENCEHSLVAGAILEISIDRAGYYAQSQELTRCRGTARGRCHCCLWYVLSRCCTNLNASDDWAVSRT